MRADRFTDRHLRKSPTLYPRVRLVLCIGCGGLFVVTLAAIFFFSRMFTIEYVVVDTVGGIDENAARNVVFDQMERTRFGIFSESNLLIFSKQGLRDELSKRFVIRSLSITKRLPQTLAISLTGEPFRLLYLSGGRILDLASDGSSMADLTDHRADESVSMRIARLIISGAESGTNENPDVPIAKGEERLDAETVQFIRAVFVLAQDRGYQPRYFEIAPALPTVTLHTREGWTVLLSSFDDPVVQLSHVTTILEERFREDRTSLHSIDVRFDNRVYYR